MARAPRDTADLVAAAEPRVLEAHALREAGLLHAHGTFFPAGIHYPPITMYPPMDGDEFLDGWAAPDGDRYVLYVHVPFCKRLCTFCHYPVVTGTGEDAQAAFLPTLGRELDLWRERLGLSRIRARSALIAGGTPTHLPPRLFAALHDELLRRVDLDGCTQLTYDVHPADLVGPEGRERLTIMRAHGATRLTLGVQEMDPALLRHMNRGHTPALVAEAMDACRAAGFEDLCVELIFGYPGQTLGGWHRTLDATLALDPDEIQLYRLKITPYGQGHGPVDTLYQRRPEAFVTADDQLRMKQMAAIHLGEHGYTENLTRVFTRTPAHTSHYTTDQCCRLLDTLGVGPSAFSSFRDRFGIHAPELADWTRRVEAGALPFYRGLIRDTDATLRWNLLLPLKNSQVWKEMFFERTGARVEQVFRSELDALAAWGLVAEDEQTVALTPKGRFFADEICTQLAHPRYQPHDPEGYAAGPLNFGGDVTSTSDRPTVG